MTMTSAHPADSSLSPHSDPDVVDFQLSDDELRAARTVKWSLPPADAIGAWVAEMDVRPARVITDALHDAIDRGMLGYEPSAKVLDVPSALVDFMDAEFGYRPELDRIALCSEVMQGIEVALRFVAPPGPVLVPVPVYPPFFTVVRAGGRDVVPSPLVPGANGLLTFDLERMATAMAAGAKTILISNPHNPVGRAYTTQELTALVNLAREHGGHIISDEIHAPLVLDGQRHVTVASIPGSEEVATVVLSATKGFSVPALKCAQLILPTADVAATVRASSVSTNYGASLLGMLGNQVAFTQGRGWLANARTAIAERRDVLRELVAEQLPQVTMPPVEAGYLAWLQLPEGTPDPSVTALAKGRVMINAGRTFGEGYAHCARLNFATSTERLERIVAALAKAWG